MDSYVWVLHHCHDVILYPVKEHIKLLHIFPVPTTHMKFKSSTPHSTAAYKYAVVWPSISTADGMELNSTNV